MKVKGRAKIRSVGFHFRKIHETIGRTWQACGTRRESQTAHPEQPPYVKNNNTQTLLAIINKSFKPFLMFYVNFPLIFIRIDGAERKILSRNRTFGQHVEERSVRK